MLRCACAWWGDAEGGRYVDGERKCDPQHYHHVGNDAADVAVDRGTGLEKAHMACDEGGGGGASSPDEYCADLSPVCGEGSHVVVGRDARILQGDIEVLG